MRDLNECQAEVFRRSKKRIRQRRNHILMVCIPLVLCIGLYAALILPAMMPAGSDPRDPGANGSLAEDRPESLACSVVRVEVSGIGISQIYTEPADILRIADQLYACAVPDSEISGATNDEVRGKQDESHKQYTDSGLGGSASNHATLGYTITLTMHDGSTTQYLLDETMLKNQDTNQTWILTQDGLDELKDLLGIPHQ